MNGYSSNRGRCGPTGTFQTTQRMMITVMPARNRAVPMKRAKPSANLPNASRSTLRVGSVERRRRPGVLSRSGFGSALATTACRRIAAGQQVQLPAPPVLRQDVVQHVVDGHCADQSLLGVHDRRVDQVV